MAQTNSSSEEPARGHSQISLTDRLVRLNLSADRNDVRDPVVNNPEEVATVPQTAQGPCDTSTVSIR